MVASTGFLNISARKHWSLGYQFLKRVLGIVMHKLVDVQVNTINYWFASVNAYFFLYSNNVLLIRCITLDSLPSQLKNFLITQDISCNLKGWSGKQKIKVALV